MKYLTAFLLVLDVLVNVVLCFVGAVLTLDVSMAQGSWRHTLSARAGHMAEKHQPYFSWVAPAIDAVFGSGNCKAQWEREQAAGSVWAAFVASLTN
jgi:small basic protein